MPSIRGDSDHQGVGTATRLREPVADDDAATKHYVLTQRQVEWTDATPGVRVYVGTTEPPSPHLNDVWIKPTT